jgi:hypothetical protein
MNNLFEYDLATNPLSFEFLIWLIHAEMARQRHKAPAPLRIRFINVDSAKAEAWLNNVFRPLLPMIDAVEDESENGELPFKPLFLSVELFLNEIAAAARWGEEVPRLHVDHIGVPVGQSPVVITLREVLYWPHRNSNLREWKKFAVDLCSKGERVIFVRDTAKAREPLEDFLVCPDASLKLDVRMGLYQCAKMNFFVSNGPVAMAMFSRVPFIYFMTQYPGAQVPRWPWATENQRTICAVDSYENLSKAWKESQRP